MGYANGEITRPVSIYDVQRAIGQSSPDLATLCKANTVNIWARYKPETAVTGLVTLGIPPITLQERTLNSYGISVEVTQVSTIFRPLVDRLRASTAIDCFTYKKPFGTIASPYRLTDFENYWHSAPVPIQGAPYNPTDTLGVTQQGTLQLYYYVDIEGSTYGLGLKDLRFQSDSQQLSEYYFGILIYNSTTYAAATQDHKIGSGSAGEVST